MPYYKIILYLVNDKISRGIRLYPEELVERVKTEVWHQVKETIGRHRYLYVDAIPMEATDPEVVAKVLGEGSVYLLKQIRNHPS